MVFVEMATEQGDRMISLASRWCPEQRLVFGGTAELWGYHLHYAAAVCDKYDRAVRHAVGWYGRHGIPCIADDSVLVLIHLQMKISMLSQVK